MGFRPIALPPSSDWVEGDYYFGNRTFTIINRETVTVLFGKVETYKINYSGLDCFSRFGARISTVRR